VIVTKEAKVALPIDCLISLFQLPTSPAIIATAYFLTRSRKLSESKHRYASLVNHSAHVVLSFQRCNRTDGA
jgi:hypothetical protein